MTVRKILGFLELEIILRRYANLLIESVFVVRIRTDKDRTKDGFSPKKPFYERGAFFTIQWICKIFFKSVNQKLHLLLKIKLL